MPKIKEKPENGEIKIDHGIPIPVSRNQNHYPIEKMEVGDSFLFQSTAGYAYCVASRANREGKPKRFSCRKVEGGYRIWRIA